MLSGYRIIKLLSDHGLHMIQRAEDLSTGKRVILKSIAPSAIGSASMIALTHEYNFLQSISSDYVIKSIDLRKSDEGLTVMILEDVDGPDLGNFLANNSPLPLELFFTLAIAITRGLGQIHAANIIHKDISPKNVVIDLAARQIKIIDFSIATELTRESQEINVKGMLEGCFPYMSPEQTGRINRYLDYRSDFYSLGATFFEMLTGQPPFIAKDPLGYIAAHIAKIPQSVGSLRSDVPPAVGKVIEILLAKSADDRYQSSAGLIYDLEQLREMYLNKREDAPFTPRTHDQSERFDLPQKLYGREQDIAKLFAKFDSAAEGNATVLLVRGLSGIGKSSLIQEVSRKFSGNQLFFLKGKFDQFNKEIPYSALNRAFSEAADQIMRMEKETFNSFAGDIRRLLGPNAAVITNLIPEFENVIGTPAPLAYLNPQESQVRISNTLLDFISVFARPADPLILFLDDMQWADIATLELLESLFTKVEFKNILIILSYRANEVPDHHPLALTLDNLASKTVVDAINLGPLELTHISQMVADTLRVEPDRVTELANIVGQKTQGNPFFIEEFLKNLWRKKLIYFDRQQNGWQYSIAGIRELDVSGSIIELLLDKMGALDARSKDALKLAAALGNKFQLSTLSYIFGHNMLETLGYLDQAIKEGLIIPLDRGYRFLQSEEILTNDSMPTFDTAFKFQHDRIQQVCYSLIAPELKKGVHLAIARILDAKKIELQMSATDIVRHYNEAIDLIVEDGERVKLIELNRNAANKALESNAYFTAKEYINTAISLHNDQDWRDHYTLMFDIHKHAAEIYYYLNKVAEGNDFVRALLAKTNDSMVKAEILSMQSLHYSALGYLREAIDTAISSYNLCGYTFPRSVNIFHVAITLVKLIVIVSIKDPKHLQEMPKITDSKQNLALKNLATIGQTAFNLGAVNCYAVAFFNAVLMTMKYGFSNLSGFSFATTSAVLMGVFKMGKLSRKLGELAVEFDKRNDDLFLRSNAATILTCFTYYWHYDHKDLPQRFNHALQLAYQAGNNFYRASAAACHARYLTDITVEQGFKLNNKMKTIAQESNSRQNFEALEIIQAEYANLLGITDYGHSLNYATFSEVVARRHVEKTDNLTGRGGYISMKLEALTLREHFKEAVWYSHRWRAAVFGIIATKYESDYRFYTFLSRIKCTNRGNVFVRSWNLIQIFYQRWCLRAFWRNNPANFADMETIAQAEMSHLFDRPIAKTMAKFEVAIQTCKAKSNCMAAIACHRAFLFAVSHKLQRLAETYYWETAVFYEAWGAVGICSFLADKYGDQYGAMLKNALATAGQTSPMLTYGNNLSQTKHNGTYDNHSTHHTPTSHSKSTSHAPVTHNNDITRVTAAVTSVGGSSMGLDIDSITKGVQAIFAESTLENLTNSILAAMMENAGASRSALILKDDNDNLMTHGLIDNDLNTKKLEPHSIEWSEVPKSFVISTLRTGKDGIIADVNNKNSFGSDPYFTNTTAKSALAIPISFKRGVIGVVYLQNSHMVNAFTAEHRQVLDIMAVSAAASIVNTRLQLSLEEKVRTKTKAVKAMLENVEQGILMIYGEELLIHPEYSSYLEEILEIKELANKRLTDILLHPSQLTNDQRSTVISSLTSMINTSIFAFRMNDHHLIRDINYEVGGKTKTLELDWSPVLDDNEDVEKILLTIRDATRVRNLQSEINQQHKDIQIFSEISKISYDLFQEFVTQSQATLAEFMSFKQYDAEILQAMFIDIHTLKGLARTYGFVALVDCYHQTEQVIAHSIKSGCLFFERITAMLQILNAELQQYVKVALVHLDHGAVMAAQSLKHIEQILTREMIGQMSDHEVFIDNLCNAVYPSLKNILQDEIESIGGTARSLGKESPKVHFVGDACRYPQESQKLLRQVFVHMFNNSIDHGIENASDRLAAGKSATGNITIEFVDDGEQPILVFGDDGRGLDLQQVRAVAERKGIIAPDKELTPEATAELIFTPEFSTKTAVTSISGRGIGMNAIKSLMLANKCEMRLQLCDETAPGCRQMKLWLILQKEMVIGKPEKRLRLAS